MKNIIIIMVAVAVSGLAAIAQPYPTTDNIVRLTDQNMPAVEYFTLEKIKLPEIFANAEYHIYKDDIAIIINYKNPQPFVVTFYNLNTKKIIVGYFKKGELVMATGDLRCNNLVVRDGFLHIVSQLNIDSVLVYGYAYRPAVTQLGSGHSCVYVGENTLTMTNPQYVNDGYGVEGLPEFVQYDAKTGKPFADYKKNDKNYPSNLTQRSIAYCNSKYIAFWYNYPIITIYDKDFNLLKMYRDDKFNDTEVVEEYSELLAKDIEDFFAFAGQTDNYILAFNGRCHVTREEFIEKGGIQWAETDDYNLARFKNQEIWFFDNDMNLVRRLKCKNKMSFIRKVSYNEKSNSLYINAKDANDEYCLYRCKQIKNNKL
ncbi:MAG: hypothetical protein IKW77_10185 [Salinivirgaceae bacterium]|nr:hypothetical protein [Salinivirgaceae bacterium]